MYPFMDVEIHLLAALQIFSHTNKNTFYSFANMGPSRVFKDDIHIQYNRAGVQHLLQMDISKGVGDRHTLFMDASYSFCLLQFSINTLQHNANVIYQVLHNAATCAYRYIICKDTSDYTLLDIIANIASIRQHYFSLFYAILCDSLYKKKTTGKMRYTRGESSFLLNWALIG